MPAALALLVALCAQPPAADAPGSVPSDEIARAVRQLGDDDYHVREQATTRLWAAGAAAEPALRAALKSPDAEVVARARDLLDKIPYGVTPDMPRRFVELIADARSGGTAAWPGVVPQLLDLGPRGLEVARRLIDRLATAPGQREAMTRTLDAEVWRLVPHLLADGQDARAEELLERSAVVGAPGDGEPTAVRHYAADLYLRGELSSRLPRWRALAEKNRDKEGEGGRLPNGEPDGKAAAVILTYLARLHGDLALARTAAERTGRTELREAALFDAGAWAELADLPPTVLTNSPALRVGLRELFLRAAGRTAEADKALAELKQQPAGGGSQAPPLLFRALMYARRPDDALAVLEDAKGADAVVPYFEILAQRHRYDDAAKVLDRPVSERTGHRWQRDTARLRIDQQLGRPERSRDVLRALQKYDRLSTAEAAAAIELIELLVALDATAEALPIAAAVLNGGTVPSEVFSKLYPKTPLAAEGWWRHLRRQHAAEPMRDTVARLPALLDGRLNSPEGRAALAAAAAAVGGLSGDEAERTLLGLGEACQAAGMVEAARGHFEEATRKADSAAAWQRLGEFHADREQFADAAAAFERAWRKDVRQPLPVWLAGWAKSKAGDAAAGRRLTELAHLVTLGDEELRYAFTEDLAKRLAAIPEAAAAARRERQLLVKLGLPTSNRARNAQSFLSNDPRAYPDRLAAADATQRFLFRMLQTNAYFKRNDGYLAVLHRLHAHRAHGLLATDDIPGAVREAAAAHALLPSHVEPAAALVPELAKRGKATEADAVYGPPAAVLDGLIRDHPASAHFAQQRALLAVRCGRDLDRALELARAAVKLAPKNAGYLETLAEVHFQRGEKAQAVERIAQALALEPKSELFAKQKARFEAGDRAVPVPEVGR